MNKQQTKHTITALYKKLDKDIDRIAAGFDIEDIHRFRVTYKKLRAFLKMLSQHKKNTRPIKISKKLKQVYTLLGRIRDIQLQQQKISSGIHTKKYFQYKNLLQQQIVQLKNMFAAPAVKALLARNKKKTVDSVSRACHPRDFKEFAEEKYAAVAALLAAAHYSDANIHCIRKHLKDVLFNLRSSHASKKNLPAATAWKGKDEKYLHQLLIDLGNFQDLCTSISLLNTRWLKTIAKNEQAALTQLKKNWTAAKISLKKELAARLFNDLTPGNNASVKQQPVKSR